MSPEGASSSHQVELPGPQQAEVVGQPATLVKVSVPTGAVPGQQINFTMPNGQRVSTSVQEQVQAGATLTVSVPSPAPAALGDVSARSSTGPRDAAAPANGQCKRGRSPECADALGCFRLGLHFLLLLWAARRAVRLVCRRNEPLLPASGGA